MTVTRTNGVPDIIPKEKNPVLPSYPPFLTREASEKITGQLKDLKTDAKDSLVGAINEVATEVSSLPSDKTIGDLSSLTTEEKGNLVGAINENVSRINENVSRINDQSSQLMDRITRKEFTDWSNQVDQWLNETAYYTEISCQKYRDSVSGTDYYLTRIPHLDKNGNVIPLKRGFADDTANGGTVETPRHFANRKGATVTVNAATFHINSTKQFNSLAIVDGKVLNAGPNDTGRYVLGIKADGTLAYFSPTTSPQTILDAGCQNALSAFIPLIVNGASVSQSIIDEYSGSATPAPRQVIAQFSNKDLLFLTCEGRSSEDTGMTTKDLIRILTGQHVNFAYMLDGGGSTQTVVKGTLINEVSDNNGYDERGVADFLYFQKPTSIGHQDILSISTDIGNLARTVENLAVTVRQIQDSLNSTP